jgi:hypothetical protein
VRLIEGLLEGCMLGFQNFELGGDGVDGGTLGKLFCKAESKFKVNRYIEITKERVEEPLVRRKTYPRCFSNEFQGV